MQLFRHSMFHTVFKAEETTLRFLSPWLWTLYVLGFLHLPIFTHSSLSPLKHSH